MTTLQQHKTIIAVYKLGGNPQKAALQADHLIPELQKEIAQHQSEIEKLTNAIAELSQMKHSINMQIIGA